MYEIAIELIKELIDNKTEHYKSESRFTTYYAPEHLQEMKDEINELEEAVIALKMVAGGNLQVK